MKVRYVGPDARVVPALDEKVVEPNDIIDVPNDLAARLIEQAVWEKHTGPKGGK